ncbi:MAG: hypothetical protein JSV19_01665 [Phycisphaerales bacterium]|nr:MAG: hypothetical protein JSV19_01665 [Phycisphaerales bacterium]
MALTANREVDRYVDQELRSYQVAAAAHIYKGGFVGLAADGHARSLAAGDRCAGLAYEEADNTSGSDGDLAVRVFTLGDFGHPLAGAAISDIGRAVYAAADDTLTFDPSGNSFVGYVQDCVTANEIILRLTVTGPVRTAMITHHSADFTLTPGDSGTVHTNRGATGTVTAILPQSPPHGTEYKFVCMEDRELRLAPGAGGVYIKGARQADGKYVSITDIGDFIHLIADGNGDWVAVASIGGADADITVEA